MGSIVGSLFGRTDDKGRRMQEETRALQAEQAREVRKKERQERLALEGRKRLLAAAGNPGGGTGVLSPASRSTTQRLGGN